MKRRKAAGELVGIGVAMFIEKSGLGPADGVQISVDTSGAVEVVTGGASLGQGFETVMAQVAADGLGVDYKKCRVIHGQTDRIAFGIGAHASRATVMTASATHIAALNVRKKALEVAGELLQAAPDTLDIINGEVVRKDQRAARRSALARLPSTLRRHRRRWASAIRGSRPKAGSASTIKSIRMAATSRWSASMRETGGVTVERYYIAYDIGRAINPALVEAQIVGGYAQGLGGALSGGVHLQRARRSARRHLCRLPLAGHARDDTARRPADRGLCDPA